MTWKRTKRDRLVESDWIGVSRDTVELPSGKETEYMLVDICDGVIVVPVKITKDGLRFILIEQYRYPLDRRQLEFPGGACHNGESKEETARRELLEETGYETENIKFIYHMNQLPSHSGSSSAVYMAVVGEQKQAQPDDIESEGSISVVEVSDDDLLKMVRDNDITDAKTIAALAVAMLQGNKVKEYLRSIVE